MAGGSFTSAGGVACNRVARWDSVNLFWSPLGAGTNNTVSALAVLPNGDLVAGGDFMVDSLGTNGGSIARWAKAAS